MTVNRRRALFWAPRGLLISYTLFVSMLGVAVFGGFLYSIVGLLVALIPSCVLAGALVIAWRSDELGTVLAATLGVLILWWGSRFYDWWAICLAGPLFVAAALFLLNWLNGRTPRVDDEL